MKTFLSSLQAYTIMSILLEHYAYKMNLEDIKSLASCMQFLPDGDTADPAVWEDWIDAINSKDFLNKKEAFDGMIRYLEIYHELTSSRDAKLLIDMMKSARENDTSSPLMRMWDTLFEKSIKNENDCRSYLKLSK